MNGPTYPIIEKVYLVGTHHYCFRQGVPAEITRVVMGTPDAQAQPRLAYEIKFSDGMVDWVPVSDVGNCYEIATFSDICSGKYKK